MRPCVLALLATLLLWTGTPATADEAPEVVHLTLPEAIALAREQNYGLAASRMGLSIDELNPYIARGIFDPRFSAALTHSSSERGITVEGDNTSQTVERTSISLNALQPTRTGGSWSIEYGAERTDVSAGGGTAWGSSANLRYTQPLLEGAGRQRTRSPITLAEYGVAITAANLERESLALEQEVTTAYLQVLRSERQILTARLSLSVAEALFEQVSAQVDAGVLARFERTNAEGGLASRREGLLIAEQNRADAYANLRRLLGYPLEVQLVLADQLNITPIALPEHELTWVVAQDARPDLQVLTLRRSVAEEQRAAAKDRLKDSLNFSASAGLSGTGDGFGDTLSEMDRLGWSIGLEYVMPIGTDHRAKGQAEQSELTLEQLGLERQEAELQIRSALSRTLRALRVAQERLEITATGVRVAEERLANERARLELGLSTTTLVLDVEEDLAEARRRAIEAELDVAAGKAALLNVMGLSQLAVLPAELEPAGLLPGLPEESGE